MPETAVKVVANCYTAGKIPSRLGRYSLTAQRKSFIPLKYGMVRKTDIPGLASPRGAENIRLPSSDLLQKWADAGEPSPVVILTTQLPRLVLGPFIMAGEKFISDLYRFCKWAIFSPHISSEGKWQDGFVVQGDEASLGRLEEDFFGENFTQLPLAKTMFLNLRDAAGGMIGATDFSWAMARLLGEMMVNPLLIARGLAAEAMGEDARKVFAARYQMGFVRSLADRLEADYGDSFRQSSDKIMFDNKLRFLKIQTQAPLPEPEAQIIEQLPAA
ncbi:hypothetical protein HZC35_02355 [Candidatus Saganbacteria bacterium]|nr:hypothetical protein [Candidatus Saganbacteria bacterium]